MERCRFLRARATLLPTWDRCLSQADIHAFNNKPRRRILHKHKRNQNQKQNSQNTSVASHDNDHKPLHLPRSLALPCFDKPFCQPTQSSLSAAVAPFVACFDAKRVTGTRIGPAVPPVDLFLQEQNTRWRVLEANPMIKAQPGVMCLAFVDGGARPRGSLMVIGAQQLEDNLVEFDLAKSMLGFSSSLLLRRTSCANFNFTSSASP